MGDDALGPAPAIPLDKVEWRVDSKPYERDGKFSCRFVPYHDARDTMDLLDGWAPWQDSFRETVIDGKPAVVCTISVNVDGEWLSRSDVGVPSNMEPQKGAFSDAFKRAAVKWGVARNVYDLPTLWAPCDTYTAAGKVQAKPNRQTLPDLLRQLKKLGFDATGGRVKNGDSATDDGDQHPPVGPSASAGGANGSADASSANAPLCVLCEKSLAGAGAVTKDSRGRMHVKCADEEPF